MPRLWPHTQTFCYKPLLVQPFVVMETGPERPNLFLGPHSYYVLESGLEFRVRDHQTPAPLNRSPRLPRKGKPGGLGDPSRPGPILQHMGGSSSRENQPDIWRRRNLGRRQRRSRSKGSWGQKASRLPWRVGGEAELTPSLERRPESPHSGEPLKLWGPCEASPKRDSGDKRCPMSSSTFILQAVH